MDNKIRVGLGFSTVKKGVTRLLNVEDPKKRVVPLIIGEQGIGKSMLVRSIAQDLDASYFEITCSLMKEGDLLMPIPDRSDDEGHLGKVKYALHTVLVDILNNAKTDPDRKQVLFLDEFNRADLVVQAELMNLVLQRSIIGVNLPDNVLLVLAANPSNNVEGFEDSEYAVNVADGAINDRTVRIRMGVNLSDWLTGFAKRIVDKDGRTQIHPMISAFLEDGNESMFMEYATDKDKKATPRAWEFASNVLYSYEDAGEDYLASDNTPFVNEALKGAVGDVVGGSLITYLNDSAYFIRPWDIINAEDKEHTALMNNFNQLQEVRRNRIVDALVDQFALTKNHPQLLEPQHTNRLIKWVLALNTDSTHTLMLKIASNEINEFVNYKDLYDAIIVNDEEGVYISKELDITVRAAKL